MFPILLLSILSSSAHAWVLVEETITPNGTDIRWTERQTGPWGGGGGSDFSDSGYGNADGQCIRCAVTEMEIRHGIAIDKIRAKYGGNWADSHGGNGGSSSTFRLNDDAFIAVVNGRSGQYIDQLQFIATDGSSYGPYGGGGGGAFSSQVQGCILWFFSGKSGLGLDQLRLHWRCP